MRINKSKRAWSLGIVAAVVMMATPLGSQQQISEEQLYRVVNKIRKRILTLSNYGVFDFITFGLKGGTAGIVVPLEGYASRPQLKKGAERVVSKVEMVELVENNIVVLPVGGMDDDIRLAVFKAIYFHPSLSRYNPNRGTPMYGPGGFGGSAFDDDPFESPGGGLWARNEAFGISNDPPLGYHPISIIVKSGNVFLEGVIDNEADKTIANMQANGVSNVFSVTNNLQVLQPAKAKKK